MVPLMRFGLGAPILDSNSVALLSIDNPIKGETIGNQLTPVQVTFKNKGFADLTNLTINWSVNGVLQTPKTWAGLVPDDFEDTVTVGYYTTRLEDFDTIVVWASLPNNVIDTNTFDDTLRVITYGCGASLAGNYIVGPNQPVYKTVDDFVSLTKLCSPAGDVTLLLESGVYIDSLNLAGVSIDNYTLTITSLAGNRDSVIFKPASGVALKLGNNKNLIIKDITFDCSPIAAYTVQFVGGCEDVIIRDCDILSSLTATSSTSTAIYKASSSGILKRVSFINNYTHPCAGGRTGSGSDPCAGRGGSRSRRGHGG